MSLQTAAKNFESVLDEVDTMFRAIDKLAGERKGEDGQEGDWNVVRAVGDEMEPRLVSTCF